MRVCLECGWKLKKDGDLDYCYRCLSDMAECQICTMYDKMNSMVKLDNGEHICKDCSLK